MGSHICPDCGNQVIAAPGATHDCPARRRRQELAAEEAMAGMLQSMVEVYTAAGAFVDTITAAEIRNPKLRRLVDAVLEGRRRELAARA